MAAKRPDFAEAYDEHVWQVYGFFSYRVRTRADAEELTQAVFERALRAWSRYDPKRASLATWLLAIARNLLIDHYRADRTKAERPLADDEEWPAPETSAGGLGLAPELEAALAELGEREREVIGLRFGGDLSGQQIARLTGLSLANVQQILSRSLRRMKDRLDSQAASGPSPATLDAANKRSTSPEQA